jgi:Leucine-rich repeat (LRR) protein
MLLVHAREQKDKTPLYKWAISEQKHKDDRSDLDIAELLLRHGASPKPVTRLELANYGLTNLDPDKFIKPFPYLKRLNVLNNQLQAIPEEILKLQNFKGLQASGNPLETIPQSFRLWPKLKDYLISIQKKATSWRERKLLFVGQEAVGKTTLVCVALCGSLDHLNMPRPILNSSARVFVLVVALLW